MITLYTNGPWSADNGGGSWYGVFDEDGAALAYLIEPADIQHVKVLPEVEQFGNPYAQRSRLREHRANAFLMAAAPELLEALRALLESNDGFGRTRAEDLARAEAAIKKASPPEDSE